tara:strand:- start:180 stop:539 length:360 start_codon:yes stop_codon:yes gene_type:complete
MQELENKKAALELLQNETNDKLNDYKQQISILQKQIDDYNKPALTPMYMDKIYDAVENAVDGFDFDDTENYDIEYGIDYDGRVYCENFSFRNASDLVTEVVDKVIKLFKEVDCPEDNNK